MVNRMVSDKDAGTEELPEAVTRYLNRAAGRNLRLRAELHANLHQRMLDHLTAGREPEAAWEAALNDFGTAPAHWPLTVRTLLAVGAMATLAYAAAAHLHLGLP